MITQDTTLAGIFSSLFLRGLWSPSFVIQMFTSSFCFSSFLDISVTLAFILVDIFQALKYGMPRLNLQGSPAISPDVWTLPGTPHWEEVKGFQAEKLPTTQRPLD